MNIDTHFSSIYDLIKSHVINSFAMIPISIIRNILKLSFKVFVILSVSITIILASLATAVMSYLFEFIAHLFMRWAHHCLGNFTNTLIHDKILPEFVSINRQLDAITGIEKFIQEIRTSIRDHEERQRIWNEEVICRIDMLKCLISNSEPCLSGNRVLTPSSLSSGEDFFNHSPMTTLTKESMDRSGDNFHLLERHPSPTSTLNIDLQCKIPPPPPLPNFSFHKSNWKNTLKSRKSSISTSESNTMLVPSLTQIMEGRKKLKKVVDSNINFL